MGLLETRESVARNKELPSFRDVASNPLVRVREIAAKAQARNKFKSPPPISPQMFLPGMDEHMRAMPNYLGRAPLFAPIAPGRKKSTMDQWCIKPIMSHSKAGGSSFLRT